MSHPRYVFAVFNFPGTTEEDLPLVSGERIEVLSRDDEFGDGWWEGINEAGQQGLFPKIYTSETYPMTSAGASVSSLNDSLSQVDEEGESEASTENDRIMEAVDAPKSLRPSIEVINQWTPYDVARHFKSLGFDDVSPKFTEHEVSGRILLAMQHTDLREIDINAFGKRFEIMQEIDILRNKEVSTEQYMQQLTGSDTTAPSGLDLTQRSAARQSRFLPRQLSAGSDLSNTASNSTGTQPHGESTALLVHRNDDNVGSPSITSPLNSPRKNGSTPTGRTSRPGSSDLINTPEAAASIASPIIRESSAASSLHKKSLSTSSVGPNASKIDLITGRRSPEKRHSRSWSQDTIKLNSHKRGLSGNLDAVGEENASSLNSTDSAPRSPSSTLGSPASGVLSSPSSSNRPTLVPKKSLLGRRPKWRPNAVSENLENVAAPEAAKDADFSGWLRKRGERSYNWKLRYFVLKGTRLAYFQTDRDTSEKGLIDINSHKVVIVDDILFYGPNRHTFKLVPPAPGASRALNFTPPKTHFFCADSKEQMRQWIAVFTKATIGRDWSSPVISSCTTKTISLKAAQEQRETRANAALAGLQPGLDLEPVPTSPTTESGGSAAQQFSPHMVERHASDTSLRRAVLEPSNASEQS